MDIVIVGVGAVGEYLAQQLSERDHNVVLVDVDAARLDTVARDLDVATKEGSGTDWKLLNGLLEMHPHMILAVTEDDQTNLVVSSLAKNLGYPRTVARIRHSWYLDQRRLDFGRIFHVDHFVSPEASVANDIFKIIISPGSLATESFAHGAVLMRTVEMPSTWHRGDQKLRELQLPHGMMVGIIRRAATEEGAAKSLKKVIFPHGNDRLIPGDEVTFIGETEAISNLHLFLGIPQTSVKSVVIVGGSLTGMHLARELCKHEFSVRLIDKDPEKCAYLADELPDATVIHHDGTDLKFLLSEKVDQADVLVACTSSDEINLLVGVLSKEAGCNKLVTVISNSRYMPIVNRLGISHVVSPRVSAANRVLTIARSDTISSMYSLYEGQAEILEVNVAMDSRVVGIPLCELGPQLPRDFLLAVIQNRGRIMIANGDRILSPGDTAIVISNPAHVKDLGKIF